MRQQRAERLEPRALGALQPLLFEDRGQVLLEAAVDGLLQRQRQRRRRERALRHAAQRQRRGVLRRSRASGHDSRRDRAHEKAGPEGIHHHASPFQKVRPPAPRRPRQARLPAPQALLSHAGRGTDEQHRGRARRWDRSARRGRASKNSRPAPAPAKTSKRCIAFCARRRPSRRWHIAESPSRSKNLGTPRKKVPSLCSTSPGPPISGTVSSWNCARS